MNTSTILKILGAVTLAFVAAHEVADAQTVVRKRILLPSGPAVQPVPPAIQVAGHRLSFSRTEAGIAVTDDAGNVICSTKDGRQIRQTLVSPDGASALLDVWKYEGHGGFYDHLVRVQKSASGWTIETLWPDGADLLPGRRWWVSELGALSNDGKTALLKMADMPVGNGTVEYSWQTWELEPPKRLGIGLTISNGKLGSE